jgi:hypothetical protein
MRFLLALTLLINLLGYLMMTNVPGKPTIVNPILIDKGYQSGREVSATRLVLLTELSNKDLASLTASASKPDLTAGPVNPACYVLGPFAADELAEAALATLLPDLASIEGLILESPSAEFWLSMPAAETPDIALNSWRQFETKKRYLEDCMEVASGLKFH